MTRRGEAEFGQALELVLFMGAARADASPAQLEELRAKLPEFEALINAGDYAGVRPAVQAVMGETWRPGPGWELQR